MKHRIKRKAAAAFCLLAAALLTSGCLRRGETVGEKTEVTVFLAASLKNAMEELRVRYETENTDVRLIYNADSSGTLKAQIEEGAACDLFFSAAVKQMDELEEDGYIKPGSAVGLLENEVVLIKAAQASTAVTGFSDMTKAENLALAGEDVPAGAYAREIFRNLGIYEAVMKMEINEGANVTAVLAAVSEGADEIGVVYATDAASAGEKTEVIASAPEGSLKTPVTCPLGLVYNEEAGSAESEAAKKFADWLSSEPAKEVFRKYGFTVKETEQ